MIKKKWASKPRKDTGELEMHVAKWKKPVCEGTILNHSYCMTLCNRQKVEVSKRPGGTQELPVWYCIGGRIALPIGQNPYNYLTQRGNPDINYGLESVLVHQWWQMHQTIARGANRRTCEKGSEVYESPALLM